MGRVAGAREGDEKRNRLDVPVEFLLYVHHIHSPKDIANYVRVDVEDS